MRGLLAEAGDVGQLAIVEGELARRETELEALQGQQRVLADQVALGTLTVHLRRGRRPTTLSEDTPGFSDGLRSGWVALVDGGGASPLAGLGLPLLCLVARRRWRSGVAPPAPAPWPTPADTAGAADSR